MRYGILGDIHGNLTALQCVLQQLGSEDIDATISVGDVVGYGAAPSQCIALLRELETTVVKGNHDAACVQEVDDRYFNSFAREALRWTRTKITKSDAAWLADLSLSETLPDCQVAHGCFANPDEFNYVQSTTDAEPSLDVMQRPVCFVGHTHVPIALVRLQDHPERTAYTYDYDIDLSEACRSLVNVGSVGQPRDGDPRTAYAVYDSEERRVWINRVEYDIDREATRIRSAGLPAILADRLYEGE